FQDCPAYYSFLAYFFAVSGLDGHHRPALLWEVFAPIGGFGLVREGMREGGLGDFARVVRLFTDPIAERRMEAVWGVWFPQVPSPCLSRPIHPGRGRRNS